MRATKTSILAAALCATVAAFAATTASAQFVGGPSKVISVQQLKANGQDDQLVVLEGDLVDQVGPEDYAFMDATGQIGVEIDDRVFAGQRVDPKTKVRLEGEYEKEFAEPNTVDVHRLTILR